MRDDILIKGGTIINISKELFLKYLEKPMRWKRNLRGQKKCHMKDNKIIIAKANIQNGFTPNYSVQDYLFTVHWLNDKNDVDKRQMFMYTLQIWKGMNPEDSKNRRKKRLLTKHLWTINRGNKKYV